MDKKGGKMVRSMIHILVSMLVFILIAFTYDWRTMRFVDHSIIMVFNYMTNDFFTFLFLFFTNFGSKIYIFPICFFVVFFFLWKRHLQAVIFIVANVIGVRQMNYFLKTLFRRERPTVEHLIEAAYYSFPSGHAMNSIAFYGFVVVLIAQENTFLQAKKRWLYTMTAVFVLIIGLSRVYLGVHYPTDIIAGFAAGWCWLHIFIILYKRCFIRQK
jgi:undecaprenyl-diphosphatase